MAFSERAAELRDLLDRALIAYHVEDAPIMEDAAYDALYDELAALEEQHPELVTPDSPTQRVGAPPSSKFVKVRHLQAMGSLDKVTNDDALLKWDADIHKRLGTSEPPGRCHRPCPGARSPRCCCTESCLDPPQQGRGCRRH